MRGTQIDIDREYIYLSGHTFPHREAIKSLGGRFCSQRKIWQLPYNESTLSQLQDAGAQLPLGSETQEVLRQEVREEAVYLAPLRPAAVDGLGVRDLLEKAEFALKTAFSSPVWVIGEVMNLAVRERAVFFSLSEEKSARSKGTLSIRAVYWRKSNLLADGLKIRVLCKVELYKDRGEISLQVMEIDENFTKGQIHLEREKVIKSLMKKGIFAKQKNLAIPFLPQRIGLITARASRALSDFLDQLNPFCGEVFVYYASMQGELTSKEVSLGLSSLKSLDLDMIVITRGGGSVQDLRWFDDESLAQMVCQYPVPVLSAIGHHEDTCVLEMVSALREKTPTAAAEFLLRKHRYAIEYLEQCLKKMIKELDLRFHFFRQRLIDLKITITKAEQRAVERRREHLRQLQYRLSQGLLVQLQERRFGIEKLKRSLLDKALSMLQFRKDKIAKLSRDLVAKDPSSWLKQGWTQLQDQSGNRLKSINDTVRGDTLRARLLDGQLELTVMNKTKGS
jgi:exodeoxyribonuclease VII large subunit